ncbi:hypothetical protein [Elizabethkingia meningoseptica]|uniref:hypothetical protein n=1 Tax=Elizabethkingia meningoseptica TaxID=238 RepID=UPI0023AF0643|nr:hypothetical protein [Elizabethkingia meningoseptica]MDE5492409.1 hypothetical protein [Elizabethkingia meningoseptica]
MIKNLFKASLWGVLSLSLLSSCRTEDGVVQQQQEKDMRFSVFVPKSGETINYADGFALLMKRYDGIHKTNMSGINNKKLTSNASASISKNASVTQSNEEYVEFNIRTETITKDNGDKMIVFPRVKENKLIGVVATILTDKETKVRYITYDDESLLYLMYKEAFQEALSRYQKQSMLPRLSASIKMAEEKEIPGVTITVPKPTPKQPDKEDPRPPVDMTEAKCPEHMMCLDRNSGGGSSDTDSPLELPLAFDIDTQGLKKNKCANSVYISLKSKVGLFKNLLGNFDDNNSILNLSFFIKDIPAPVGLLTMGQTSTEGIRKGYINITLNPNGLGSTNLGIAKTFIHEMIHAKMIRDLVNAGWDGDKSLKEINPESLPTLLDAYKKYNYNDDNMSQHKFMSEYYIPKIANALAQFDGNKHDKADYENLAWTGLQTTDAYKALSKEKRDKITEANNTFNSKSPCGK